MEEKNPQKGRNHSTSPFSIIEAARKKNTESPVSRGAALVASSKADVFLTISDGLSEVSRLKKVHAYSGLTDSQVKRGATDTNRCQKMRAQIKAGRPCEHSWRYL